MNRHRILVVLALSGLLVLSGCGKQSHDDADASAKAARILADAQTAELARNYQQAREAQQWDLALAYAAELQHKAPNSVPMQEVQATLTDTGIHADEVRDKRRLSALWVYNIEPVNSGTDGVVISAYLYSDRNADPEGSAPVRIVLRKHPQWGRSVYLVLDSGEFDCDPKCNVLIQFDDQPAREFAATKPRENKSALFIDDEQTIRDALDKIRVITIKTSVHDVPRTLRFEVGGFDRIKLERRA